MMLLLVGISMAMAADSANTHASDAVLVEFSSQNCPPCRAMHSVVSELIAQGVPVRQIDVGREPHQARRFRVRSTPTYVVLNEGREVARLTGVQKIETLRAALQETGRGPLVATRSQSRTFNQPQTRLAPLPGQQDRSYGASTSRAVRQPAASASEPNADWHSLASTTPAAVTPPSSESLPNATLADSIERAQAATVRLRVYDGRGYGAGTGTIIDVNGEEALVLTCGHLFRDSHGDQAGENHSDNKIEVDVFVGGQPQTVVGQLIDFDAGDRDIGLVAIRPGFPVKPVAVLAQSERVRVGQTAFSFGCDRGDPPTRRDTRITGVDKYNQNIGASNLEISGAPIDGRSGGGLFDEQGRLIGVCNAADYKSDIGIYTGPRSVYWQLDRVKLAKLYEDTPGQPASAVNSLAQAAPESANAPPAAALASSQTAGLDFPSPKSSASEMIVILRHSDGSIKEQVLTLNRPEASLVQQIRNAALRR